VHYVHDVASGLALGAAVVALAVVALRPAVRRLPRALVATKPVVHRQS